MDHISSIPSCLWLDGLVVVSLVAGHIAATIVVETLRFLGSVPRFTGSIKHSAFTVLTGVIERLAVTLLTVWSAGAALAFSGAWVGLKMAAGWNRPGRQESYQFGSDVSEPEQWMRAARGAISSLLGSLVSLGFGIVGGLVVRGEVPSPLSFC